MKKQIIVSIDPFNIQQNVVGYAIKIAKKLDLPLLLFSVQQHTVMPVAMDTGGQAASFQELPPDWGKTIEQKMNVYYERIKKIYPNTKFEHDLGMLADSVVNQLHTLYESASKRSPFLLVASKTSEYNWWNDLIGTAETAIASDAPCPVLFVPENNELEKVNRILYLADREPFDNYDYSGFTMLNRLSVNLGAKITIGFIAEEKADQSEFNIGEAMRILRRNLPNQTDHEFRFFNDLGPDEILKMAKLTQMDIVAFPFREASLFDRFFKDEVARTLVLKADVPTLVF